MDNERIVIGQNLKRYRQSKNMTLKQLAEATDISFGFLSKIERGVGNPSSATLQKLAYALQITVNDLVGTSDLAERTGTAAVKPESFVLRKKDRVEIYGVTNMFDYYSVLEETPHLKVNVMTLYKEMKEQIRSIHSYDEFGIVASGVLSVELQAEDGGPRQHYELTEGECIMVRARTYHYVKSLSDEPCVTYWLELL